MMTVSAGRRQSAPGEQMTRAERGATQTYAANLGSMFRANAHAMAVAKLTGQTHAYNIYVGVSAKLWREMQLVAHSLITGLLPF